MLAEVILALDVANTHATITTSKHLAFFLSPQDGWRDGYFLACFLSWKFPTPYNVTEQFGNVWVQKRDSEILQTIIGINTQIFYVYPICRFVVLPFLANYSNPLFSYAFMLGYLYYCIILFLLKEVKNLNKNK